MSYDRNIVKSYLMRGQQHFMTMKKSDGRIEVPRLLINEMRWGTIRWAFFYKTPDAILIYPSDEGNSDSLLGKIAVSSGRIRVPLNILNKVGFCGQSFAVAKENDHLLIRPYDCDRSEELDKFIDTLGLAQLRMLSNFIIGRPIDTDTEHLIGLQLTAKPIFLANKANTVFRAVGLPFRFFGFYLQKTQEILTSTNNCKKLLFHAIPGIRRDNNRSSIGYLIVNSTTYGSILAALQNSDQSGVDVELLFIYDPISDNPYRAYINPLSEVFNRDVNIARMLCSDPNSFVKQTFRQAVNSPSGVFPESPVLTDGNVQISTNLTRSLFFDATERY